MNHKLNRKLVLVSCGICSLVGITLVSTSNVYAKPVKNEPSSSVLLEKPVELLFTGQMELHAEFLLAQAGRPDGYGQPSQQSVQSELERLYRENGREVPAMTQDISRPIATIEPQPGSSSPQYPVQPARQQPVHQQVMYQQPVAQPIPHQPAKKKAGILGRFFSRFKRNKNEGHTPLPENYQPPAPPPVPGVTTNSAAGGYARPVYSTNGAPSQTVSYSSSARQYPPPNQSYPVGNASQHPYLNQAPPATGARYSTPNRSSAVGRTQLNSSRNRSSANTFQSIVQRRPETSELQPLTQGASLMFPIQPEQRSRVNLKQTVSRTSLDQNPTRMLQSAKLFSPAKPALRSKSEGLIAIEPDPFTQGARIKSSERKVVYITKDEMIRRQQKQLDQLRNQTKSSTSSAEQPSSALAAPFLVPQTSALPEANTKTLPPPKTSPSNESAELPLLLPPAENIQPDTKSGDPLSDLFPEDKPKPTSSQKETPYSNLTLEPTPSRTKPQDSPSSTPKVEEPIPLTLPKEETKIPTETSSVSSTSNEKKAADSLKKHPLLEDVPSIEQAETPHNGGSENKSTNETSTTAKQKIDSADETKSNSDAASETKPTPSSSTKDPTAEENASPSPLAQRRLMKGLKGFCPVELRDHRDLVDTQLVYAATYKSRAYFFSSAEAQKKFETDPERYVPVAQGNDVVLLAQESKTVEGSLDHAAWFRDRLYLFSNKVTLLTFASNPAKYARELPAETTSSPPTTPNKANQIQTDNVKESFEPPEEIQIQGEPKRLKSGETSSTSKTNPSSTPATTPTATERSTPAESELKLSDPEEKPTQEETKGPSSAEEPSLGLPNPFEEFTPFENPE